jgi:hypothetical protein
MFNFYSYKRAWSPRENSIVVRRSENLRPTTDSVSADA